uniref:MTSS I-BAR domain containing 2 n=1 Tax=Panthera tigris altaica TaxID=74533 RepID=A0A8C9JZC5_PANTA
EGTAEGWRGALGSFPCLLSYPIWEDFNSKATKLHSQLRTTVLAAVAFLDAFQKVADMATNTRGGEGVWLEVGFAPGWERLKYKRARHEIKKKSSDTLKLQKKARKGKGDLQPQLDSALQDVNDMYLLLEETEKQAVRRALIEERGRFCTFITFLQPVVNGELTMLGEITHLQGIIDDLVVLTAEPHKLPPASEQVIKDLKGSDYSWSYQTPPSSPSGSGSRKSSMCSLAQPAATTARLSSVSSHDSGFVSQDATYSKPPSPMPSDITSQKSSSSASSEASETCQSVSECSSPTSDWAKAGPHEQPSGTSLQRRKDRLEHPRDTEPGLASGGTLGPSGEEAPRPRMSPATIAAKVGISSPGSPASASARSLTTPMLPRALSLDHQKSSRDSLHFSSGYSTQTTTPSCSEDTIPSQGSDYDCYSVNGDADGEGPHPLWQDVVSGSAPSPCPPTPQPGTSLASAGLRTCLAPPAGKRGSPGGAGRGQTLSTFRGLWTPAAPGETVRYRMEKHCLGGSPPPPPQTSLRLHQTPAGAPPAAPHRSPHRPGGAGGLCPVPSAASLSRGSSLGSWGVGQGDGGLLGQRVQRGSYTLR